MLIFIMASCLVAVSAFTAFSPAFKSSSVDGLLVSPSSTDDASLSFEPKDVIFYDNFEYDVSRSGQNVEVAFRAHGWSDVKANNSYYRRGAGFVFTQFDPILKSRVLVMESLPSTVPIPRGFRVSQTDYYLKIGNEKSSLTTIPADAWIQFLTYATPDSRFAGRDKTIYPCRGSYPCQRGQWGWLFMWGAAGYEKVLAPEGGRFLALEAEYADFRGTDQYPTNARKLFQNMRRTPLLADRWYQVKLHIDVSGEQGVYEAWVREKGMPWQKVAEWLGGVTQDFYWPIPEEGRLGFRQLATPTTVGGPADSTTYMDDFVIAFSEKELP